MKITLIISMLLTISGCQKIESLITGKIYLSCDGGIKSSMSNISEDYLEEWTEQAVISVVVDRNNVKINERSRRFIPDQFKVCSNNELVKFDSYNCKNTMSEYDRLIHENYSHEQAMYFTVHGHNTFGTFDKITKRLTLVYKRESQTGLMETSSGDFLCKEVDI